MVYYGHMKKYDVIIIGAGAAGLAAAGIAVKRGRNVAIMDCGASPARKVAVSGGGRCNFTNLAAGRDRYFGKNPDFVRGALSRVTPHDILQWATAHNIEYVEKAPGQYFCATTARAVVDALRRDANAAQLMTNTTVTDVQYDNDMFTVQTSSGDYQAHSVIVATGGISFETLGVSDAGYKIAKSFGHKIVPVRPALCAIATHAFDGAPVGAAILAEITIGRDIIRDSMLITHFGIGGPATYRATVRDIDTGIKINMMPGADAYEILRAARTSSGRKSVHSVLSAYMPTRIARWITNDSDKNIADYNDASLRQITERIQNIVIAATDIKLHGMQSAEVVRGGVSTADVSSKTMESKLRPGLFFAGEVLDIAGDLGGFNLHWAWASGRIAGENA